jgi:acyl-homoserine-lactone acylase
MKRQQVQFASSFTLRRIGIAATLLFSLAGCSSSDDDASGETGSTAPPPVATASRIQVDVGRTAYGVPHVKAKDFRSLGYGLAYAYAQDNVCMFADTVLTVRGERSQFFGGEARAPRRSATGDEYGAMSGFMDLNNEDSDFFFKGYLDIEQLRASYAAGAPEPRELVEGYVEGYNRYVKAFAGVYPAACNNAKWVRPITVDDMYLIMAEKALHATGQVFAKEFVAAGRSPVAPLASAKTARKFDPAFLLARLDQLNRQGFGSNALAVGKDLSANGRGLLLGNPHYPWTSADRFYQAHLTVPNQYDAMGVIIGGIPAIVIGFNRDVAWSHTVTTAIHFTTFRLALDPADTSGTTYLYDGAPVKMTSKTVSVDLLQADGTTAKRTKTFWFSQQGAVIVKPEAGMTWTASAAYVLADPNRNNTRMLEQWLGIGRANTVQALKASLDKTIGLPWVNTLAADRNGNVLFADASVVPHMGAQKFANGCLLLQAVRRFAQQLRLGSGCERAGRDLFASERAVGDPHRLRRQFERQLLAEQSESPADRTGSLRLLAAVWPRRRRAEPAYADRLQAVRGAGGNEKGGAGRPADPGLREPPVRGRAGAAGVAAGLLHQRGCRPAASLHCADGLGPPRERRQPRRRAVP